MANTCTTYYMVEGEKTQLDKLYQMMVELQRMKAPGLVENGYGSRWMGNLVTKLGGDWEKTYCRGEWFCLEMSEDDASFGFMVESAWCELGDVRGLLKEQFPELKFWYTSEESGCEYYVTNRPEELYYMEIDSEYVEAATFEDIIGIIECETGAKGLKTLEDCQAALRLYSKDREGYSFIYKYEYVAD